MEMQVIATVLFEAIITKDPERNHTRFNLGRNNFMYALPEFNFYLFTERCTGYGLNFMRSVDKSSVAVLISGVRFHVVQVRR